MTNADSIPPHMIAAADQEFTAIRNELDHLIELWKIEQPSYALEGLDSLATCCTFMTRLIRPRLDSTGAYAALAIAINRLAGKDTP